MKDSVVIKSEDFSKLIYLIEKILYIVHKAESREDCDNNAYSLAIVFAKEKIEEELL